jgi:hypothetical protein
MGKPALGKGMKDLLAKNIGMAKKKPSEEEADPAQELKVNMERYGAQGFDISTLAALEGKDEDEVTKGIEEYRAAVKKLISAQTVIRSLEGYGYNEEIEEIMKGIKNPVKADNVLTMVEELRDRALTEHNIKAEKSKGSPRKKLSEALKAQSEKLNHIEDEEDENIDLDSLDDMLEDLNDIGDAFSLEMDKDETDPILEKIKMWEEDGYFVDRLKALMNEDRGKAMEEIEVFEQGIKEMKRLKKRYAKMNLSDEFSDQIHEIEIKFQYPHMASEIRNELDAIEKRIEDELKAALPQEEIPVEDEKPTEPEAPEEKPKEKAAEAPPPEDVQGESLEEIAPGEEAHIEEASEEEVSIEEEPSEPIFPDLSLEELLEKAKEVYRDGDMELSLKCFEEIIKRDPENSKARFMIRRLSSKK